MRHFLCLSLTARKKYSNILRYLTICTDGSGAEHPLYLNPSSLMTMNFDEKLGDLMHCKVRENGRHHQCQQYYKICIPQTGASDVILLQIKKLSTEVSPIMQTPPAQLFHFIVIRCCYAFLASGLLSSNTSVPSAYCFLQRALARSIRLLPIIRGSNPASLKICVGFLPARYSRIK